MPTRSTITSNNPPDKGDAAVFEARDQNRDAARQNRLSNSRGGTFSPADSWLTSFLSLIRHPWRPIDGELSAHSDPRVETRALLLRSELSSGFNAMDQTRATARPPSALLINEIWKRPVQQTSETGHRKATKQAT